MSKESLIGQSTHYYVHRRHKDGLEAPLPCGRDIIVCDVYECERKPRVGESGTAYRDYALQCCKLVKTTMETLYVQ